MVSDSNSSISSLAGSLAGPFLIGALFNMTLHGMMLMQLYIYFTNSRSDRTAIKALVGYVSLIATASATLAGVVAYRYCVTDFGNANAIIRTMPPLGALVVSIAMNSAPVQLFFAWRVKQLTGKIWLFVAIIVADILQFGFAVTTVVLGNIVVEYSRYGVLRPYATAWLVLSSITDVTITTVLVRYLRKHRTGFRETDDLLNRINKLSIQTGGVTAFVSVLGTVLMMINPTNNIYFAFDNTLPILYAICLLGALNARSSWDTSGARHFDPTYNVRGDFAFDSQLEAGPSSSYSKQHFKTFAPSFSSLSSPTKSSYPAPPPRVLISEASANHAELVGLRRAADHDHPPSPLVDWNGGTLVGETYELNEFS